MAPGREVAFTLEAAVNAVDLSSAELVPNLPDYFRPREGDPIPADLIGAEIVAMGTLPDRGSVEGGGLVIDYRPAGTDAPRRVVFAFNELGMWVVFPHRRHLA